jgi:hypothetical protein
MPQQQFAGRRQPDDPPADDGNVVHHSADILSASGVARYDFGLGDCPGQRAYLVGQAKGPVGPGR